MKRCWSEGEKEREDKKGRKKICKRVFNFDTSHRDQKLHTLLDLHYIFRAISTLEGGEQDEAAAAAMTTAYDPLEREKLWQAIDRNPPPPRLFPPAD